MQRQSWPSLVQNRQRRRCARVGQDKLCRQHSDKVRVADAREATQLLGEDLELLAALGSAVVPRAELDDEQLELDRGLTGTRGKRFRLVHRAEAF